MVGQEVQRLAGVVVFLAEAGVAVLLGRIHAVCGQEVRMAQGSEHRLRHRAQGKGQEQEKPQQEGQGSAP